MTMNDETKEIDALLSKMNEFFDKMDNRFNRLEGMLAQLIELIDAPNKQEVLSYEQRLQKSSRILC